jgi:hypothetical protein
LVDQGRKPLSGELEIDEGFIRGTRGAWRGGKSVVLVAAEEPVRNFVCEAWHDQQEHVCQARRERRMRP